MSSKKCCCCGLFSCFPCFSDSSEIAPPPPTVITNPSNPSPPATLTVESSPPLSSSALRSAAAPSQADASTVMQNDSQPIAPSDAVPSSASPPTQSASSSTPSSSRLPEVLDYAEAIKEAAKELDNVDVDFCNLINYISQLLDFFEEKTKGENQSMPEAPVGSKTFLRLKEVVSEGVNAVKDIVTTDGKTFLMGFLKGMGMVHMVTTGFLVAASILERHEAVSENKEDCLYLLKEMNILAKYLQKLQQRPALKEWMEAPIREATTLIVEASIDCFTQIGNSNFSNFFSTTVNRKALATFQKRLADTHIHRHDEMNLFQCDRIISLKRVLLNEIEMSLLKVRDQNHPEYPKGAVGMEECVEKLGTTVGMEECVEKLEEEPIDLGECAQYESSVGMEECVERLEEEPIDLGECAQSEGSEKSEEEPSDEEELLKCPSPVRMEELPELWAEERWLEESAEVAEEPGSVVTTVGNEDPLRKELKCPEYPKFAVGIERPVKEVIERLEMDTDKNAVAVIVHGFGGVGKTTLADAVFARLFDTHRQEYKYSYVRLFDNPASTPNILESQELIIKALKMGEEPKVELQRYEEGQVQIESILEKEVVFIYIDNVLIGDEVQQSGDALEQLLPKNMGNAKKLRLLITARTKDAERIIARKNVKTESYAIQSLPEAEAAELLKNTLGDQIKQLNPGQIDEIVKIYGGIPKLLKIVAGFISCEENTQEAYITVMEIAQKCGKDKVGEDINFFY